MRVGRVSKQERAGRPGLCQREWLCDSFVPDPASCPSHPSSCPLSTATMVAAAASDSASACCRINPSARGMGANLGDWEGGSGGGVEAAHQPRAERCANHRGSARRGNHHGGTVIVGAHVLGGPQRDALPRRRSRAGRRHADVARVGAFCAGRDKWVGWWVEKSRKRCGQGVTRAGRACGGLIAPSHWMPERRVRYVQ